MHTMKRYASVVAFLATATLLLWHAAAPQRTPVLIGVKSVVSTSSATSGAVFLGAKVRSWRTAPTSVRVRKHLARAGAPWLPDTGRSCRHYAVVTTIFRPSPAVNGTCHRLPDWCLVVVADCKGPATYPLNGPCAHVYLTVDAQRDMARTSPFVRALPWNHFGRKNVGYLYAIAQGAQRVWDFDDDNGLVVPGDVLERAALGAGAADQVQGWGERQINPYPLLGATKFAWPRGLPLDAVQTPSVAVADTAPFDTSTIGIVQSLANVNPDVDAIYRLTRPLPLDFARADPAACLVVPPSVFAPFNAQATLFARRDMLWALYLPVTVHGRVSDIWRSYFVQRLMWDAGARLAFAGPWVDQIRNEHTLLADFDAEHDLYIKARALVDVLSAWVPQSTSLPGRIVELYREMHDRKFIEADDVSNVERWVEELQGVGYEF